MVARYFPELAIGEDFETGSATLTRDEIVQFARLYDPQPMHVDEEAARNTIFRRLVASGWHVACTTIRLMVDARPFGANPLVGIEVDEFRFHAAVEPGTTLRCRAKILGLEQGKKPNHGHVKLRVETMDVNRGDVVLSQIWTVLVPREPPPRKPPASE